MVKAGVCVFFAGVAILSNAPERLPEKKKPERGERERGRGHGSGGTNNPGSHGSSRQVSCKTCIMFSYFRTLRSTVKPEFQILVFCIFCDFTHGPGPLSIRTMFPDFMPF
jgi:hypothetical protein